MAYRAEAVNRILEINETLPADKKIRVISMSMGWWPTAGGYKQMQAAAEKAVDAGILFVAPTQNMEQLYGFDFQGSGRRPADDPDDFSSYRPGLFWANRAGHSWASNRLLVPTDSRALSSPTGTEDYFFTRMGGASWAIPYIAGAYVLSVQVDTNITPERFWMLAMKTGRTIQLDDTNGKTAFGPILDPIKLIDAIQAGELTQEAALKAELAKYKRPASPGGYKVSP